MEPDATGDLADFVYPGDALVSGAPDDGVRVEPATDVVSHGARLTYVVRNEGALTIDVSRGAVLLPRPDSTSTTAFLIAVYDEDAPPGQDMVVAVGEEG